ncbi:Amidohydrolase 2 [Frankia sp. AiPs1]|uniref:amidohydrolase family protein n=1 Tax=Frankia sp. AiPa1 TaxID=573492 RepID=UPI00202AFEF6|nr:amidohydrolase family protein [Frankia sp. AiPa1]MCL9762137.1 amidohydrolase [Frankia sp. AiPa1]
MPQVASEQSERYIVVSTDSHVGPSVAGQLRDYCEAKHLDDFDRFVAEMDGHGLLSWRSSEATKPGEEESWSLGRSRAELGKEQAAAFGKVAGIRNADQVDQGFLQRSYEASLVPGLQDHAARIADMDRAGTAASVIYHGGLNGQSIPFSTTGLISWGNSSYNHLEPAGVRIYNRWLAGFVSEAPERHAGIAHIPISDPEACVREVEWAAEAGLKGINLPAPRSDLPMLNDPVWEPLWAVCEETGLSLNTHGGGGEHYPYKGPGAQSMYMMETTWRTRRGVWVMILAGVFNRHPALRLVMTEQWMDWAPQVMADMDGLYSGPGGSALRATLPEKPSTYFHRNCFIGASFMANWEAKFGVEHDLVANTMWGDDYPHAEGTWPHTREAIRSTFWDIAPQHTRRYLGETAIEVYGLDHAKLRAVADRIGPTPDEIANPFTPAEDEAVGLYAFRNGPGIFA